MITDVFIQTFGDMVLFFLGEMDPVEMPSWVNSIASFTGTIFGSAGQMGAWFNWGLLAVVVGGLITIHLIAFGIHIVRIIASFLTLGGGAT